MEESLLSESLLEVCTIRCQRAQIAGPAGTPK